MLERKVNERLDEKHAKYIKYGHEIDVLLIHTGEPYLMPADVEIWLKELEFGRRSTIKNAYLLMKYDPSYAQHWPVFRLYGSM